MNNTRKTAMRTGPDEDEEVTGTDRNLGNKIDIWSDGFPNYCMIMLDLSESLFLLSGTVIFRQ